MDERDPGLRLHSDAVARMSVEIGARLGLSRAQREELRRAALLHDIGKLAVPDAVLCKPGPLDAREYSLIRSHPVWGHRITLAMGWVRESCWVLHHHERPDGGGYPHGISHHQIALEASILHAADAFDALTADRPYRPALSRADALCTIVDGAGTDFDPDCVAVLAAAMFASSRTQPCA
jgi:HD-GYP domain-containing protein (c-di-GMP phosphodiesterase class II)